MGQRQFLTAEAANRALLPSRGAGQYEVWYLTGAAPEQGLGFWLRQTLHWPRPGAGERHGRLWAAVFEEARGQASGFGLQATDQERTCSTTKPEARSLKSPFQSSIVRPPSSVFSPQPSALDHPLAPLDAAVAHASGSLPPLAPCPLSLAPPEAPPVQALWQPFRWDDVAIDDQPFRVRIGPGELRHDAMRGRAQAGALAAEWDLTWRGAEEVVDCLPGPIRRSRFNQTLWRCPNQDLRVDGVLRMGDRRWELRGAPATQSHILGRRHAHRWCWGHAATFPDAPDCCVEFLSARIKRGPLVTPALTVLRVQLDGRVYDCCRMRALLSARGALEPGRFALRAETGDDGFALEVRFRPEHVVAAEYHDPDGRALFCHNTEIAAATLAHRRRARGGWVEQRRLEAPTGVAFEYGRPTADPAVAQRFTVGSLV